MINAQFNSQPQQLQAVKSSPIDERISSLAGNVASLESEIESLCKQLAPVMIAGQETGFGSKNAAPAPQESSVETAIRNFDDRIYALWQSVSALRSQLRV